MLTKTTIVVWVFAVLSGTQLCVGQNTALQIAKSYAESYVPSIEGPTHLVDVPDSVVKAFQELGRSNEAAAEEYLTLVFLKIYHSHLICCHQSYEIRNGIILDVAIDSLTDPLLYEFNRITGVLVEQQQVEFLSSSFAYDRVKENNDLMKSALIRSEVVAIDKLVRRINGDGPWED